MFSATFEMDAENMAPYERPVGTGKPNSTVGNGAKDTGNWKTSAPFEDWGDENACDGIALDGLQASQAIAAMQDAKEDKTSNGISLGYKLVHGRGNRIKFHKIAKKFLKNYERKSKEGEEGLKEAQEEGGYSTDLMGGRSKQAQGRADHKSKSEEGKGKSNGKGKEDGAKIIPGWRTQHRDMRQNATLSDNGILFFGLGNCEHTEIPDIELLMSKKLDKVINYYMKILRIECMKNVEEKLVDLINQGFLKMAKDGNFGYFQIPESNKLM